MARTRYAWVITRDAIAEPTAAPGTHDNAVGIIGPRGCELIAGDFAAIPHTAFRMYDGDDVLYYEGLFVGDARSEEAFGPLDDFGRPNAGCTRIDYLVDGKWETL